ncbi:MAG: hypothetical protein LC649_01440 [Bacteroidales bacterium]|nr:hypothetical protein [Bacteroidales bacterium]
MTLDNGKTIIRLRLNLLIATVVFIIYLFFAYFERFDKQIKFPIFGLSDTASTLILVAIYLLVALYPMIFNYNFIYFSDDGPSVVLRFYSVGITKGTRKSIEIEKQRFVGYVKKSGLISSSVALIERVDRRDATYPPVSLTSLTRNERKKLFTMLDRYGSAGR